MRGKKEASFLQNRRLQNAYQSNQSKQCSPRARPQSKQQRARLTHGLLRSRQHRTPKTAAQSTRCLDLQPSSEEKQSLLSKICRADYYKELIKKINQNSAAPAPGHSPNSSGRALPKVCTRCVRVNTVLQKQPHNRLVAFFYSNNERDRCWASPAEHTITKRLSIKSIKAVQPPRPATVQTAAGAPYSWFAAFASAPYSRSSRTIDSFRFPSLASSQNS